MSHAARCHHKGQSYLLLMEGGDKNGMWAIPYGNAEPHIERSVPVSETEDECTYDVLFSAPEGGGAWKATFVYQGDELDHTATWDLMAVPDDHGYLVDPGQFYVSMEDRIEWMMKRMEFLRGV